MDPTVLSNAATMRLFTKRSISSLHMVFISKLGMLGSEAKDEAKPKNAKDRKKLKLKEKRAEAKQAKVEAKRKEAENEMNSAKRMVRAAKSKAAKLRESGVASALAGKMAASAVDQTKKRKQK
eukprot:scaffold40624_cov29-Prasinocladus_malaysianus.AAC.2